jgi:pseudaminic acid synthase
VADQDFAIAGRLIGREHPPYVVAEVSANHRQDYDEAVRIIEAAAAAGADAVKLQTYTPDTITIRCDNPCFRIEGSIWDGRNLHDLFKEAFTPWEWQPKLKQVAEQSGLQLFSSPFDPGAVDFLEMMGVPAYKIASFELVDLPLLREVAKTGKPIILSTGMATLAEIDEAVRTIREAGGRQLALLKCTSAYPAPLEQMNLRAISELARVFRLPVGLSDHTLELAVPVASVALGATIIEKHLTLSRAAGGCDSPFSLDPNEFRAMVQAVRQAHLALGSVSLGATEEEDAMRRFRRSLFVVKDVKAGERFTEENVRSIRPADGLHPRYYEQILGREAKCDLPRGTPLEWKHVGQGGRSNAG